MAGAVRGAVAAGPLVTCSGIVTEVTPSAYRISGLSPFVRLGDTVSFETDGVARMGEIVRVQRMGATVKPFGPQVEARLGLPVRKGGPLAFAPDPTWKGRVVNALCAPVDGLGPLRIGPAAVPADAEPPAALRRSRVKGSLRTGVRAIDIFCPICPGQRIGIFAGSGVGKSTLLAMLAAAPGFDTVVIALVGERGREVREFIEDSLGDNRSKAVTVVATGDESPMMRRLAPKTAMCIAEMFRDRGEQVLLIVDSVTRFAHAARDVALAAGEPAVARGYAPSVFSDLPKLLETFRSRSRRLGQHHRHLFRPGRWRRPQRSCCRYDPGDARWPYRARPQDRGPGSLSRGGPAGFALASGPPGLDNRSRECWSASCAR